MLLRDFIVQINETFKGLLPDLKVFGLAQLVRRQTGSVEETLPGIIDRDGEVTFVGPDDIDAVRIYHRLTGATSSRSTNKGVGDSENDIVNSYQMAMIVYMDHKRSKLFPEELFLYLQANMPDGLNSEPYKRISIRTGNIIFNSQAIYAAEYAGSEFKLPAEQSLFQINYTIETTFKKGCFSKCPDC
jgi:hypothetical protein